MMKPILIVEDDPDLREALCTTLELAGYSVLLAHHGVQALDILRHHAVGVVFSDIRMQPMDGISLLREIKRSDPATPVVLMTAYAQVEHAVSAMRDGASDYLLKPFEPARLLALAAQYSRAVGQTNDLGIVAHDPATLDVLALADKVAKFSTTVLLTGESGAGKEVVARYIHHHSPQREQAFIAINCAAIPENLLEATLFGYEKGAFTGASQLHQGKFEQAHGGTLLLDEISEIPLGLQAKLLRVLQERVIERVGGNKSIPVDIRVVATSNKDLQALVARKEFREDLFYRLNVFPLWVPPLRSRTMDIVPLAQFFLEQLGNRLERTGLQLSQAAAEWLRQYSWPGNVRELENVMHRAIILTSGGVVEIAQLNLAQSTSREIDKVEMQQMSQPSDMDSVERMHIMRTLAEVNGSRKLAVKKLGISERTLRYKLQRYRQAEMN
jgi:two-component system, response regulator FlrC